MKVFNLKFGIKMKGFIDAIDGWIDKGITTERMLCIGGSNV